MNILGALANIDEPERLDYVIKEHEKQENQYTEKNHRAVSETFALHGTHDMSR